MIGEDNPVEDIDTLGPVLWSYFRKGSLLCNLSRQDGRLYTFFREEAKEEEVLEGLYFVPMSLLSDRVDYIKDIRDFETFKREMSLRHLNEYIRKGIYSETKMLHHTYGKNLMKYFRDMYAVFSLVIFHSGKSVATILEIISKKIKIKKMCAMHFLAMLTLLGFIDSLKTREKVRLFHQGEDVEILPEEVTIYVTYMCNLNCNMCGIRNASFFFEEKERDLFFKKQNMNLEKDTAAKIAQECDKPNYRVVYIDGGEPLVHPDIWEILEDFSGRHFLPVLLTNGTLLDQGICDFLMRNGWKVIVSFDGTTEQVHDKIRGPDTFKKATKGVDLLREARHTHGRGEIEIHMVLQGQNVNEMEKYPRFAHDLGVDDFYIDLYQGIRPRCYDESSYGRIRDALQNMSLRREGLDHISWMRHFNTSMYERDSLVSGQSAKNFFANATYSCHIFPHSMTIDPAGDVYPCWKTLQSFNCMGNVVEESVDSVWFSESYTLFKKGLREVRPEDRRFQNCVFCECIPEICTFNEENNVFNGGGVQHRRERLFIDFLPHGSVEDFCQLGALEVQTYKDYLDEEYEIVTDFRQADVILFYGCASFSDVQEKNIEMVRRLYQEKKKGARLIVVGCLPHIAPEALKSISSDIMDRSFEDKLQRIKVAAMRDVSESNRYAKYHDPKEFIIRTGEGCAQNCSYCSVKLSRGRIRSKNKGVILDEFERGLDEGFSTFVLVGTDVGSYGVDIGTDIVTLLESLSDTIHSRKILPKCIGVEIEDFNPAWIQKYADRLIHLLRESPFVKRISIPLESASQRLLSRMRRNYDPEKILEILNKLRLYSPRTALDTHFMIGFPGEQEKDFQQIYSLIQPFSAITLIPFDSRPGTEAFDMTGHVSERIKNNRLARCYLTLRKYGKDVKIFPLQKEEEILGIISDKLGDG